MISAKPRKINIQFMAENRNLVSFLGESLTQNVVRATFFKCRLMFQSLIGNVISNEFTRKKVNFPETQTGLGLKSNKH